MRGGLRLGWGVGGVGIKKKALGRDAEPFFFFWRMGDDQVTFFSCFKRAGQKSAFTTWLPIFSQCPRQMHFCNCISSPTLTSFFQRWDGLGLGGVGLGRWEGDKFYVLCVGFSIFFLQKLRCFRVFFVFFLSVSPPEFYG